MREFIYFSAKGRTSGNFKDLMKAGRMDIVINTLIAAFFLSNKRRDDVLFHLILNGPPDPPKHLIFDSREEIPFSKKDVSGLIRRMLFKYKRGKRVKAFPGCYVEKKSFQNVIKECIDEGKDLFLLDKKGRDIRSFVFSNPVFILGDHEGLPKTELKFVKKYARLVSVGPKVYFSSQVITLVNNELDRQGF